MKPRRLVLTKSTKTKYLQKKYFPIATEVLKNEQSFLFQNWFFLCDQSASLESVITTVCLCLNNIDAIICQKCNNLGMGDATKTEFFLKSSKGGGVIFNPNIYVANSGPVNRAFFGCFPKTIADFFPKMRDEGVKDRLELVRKFICFGSVTRPLCKWNMFQVDVPVLATAEFGRGNYVSIKIFKRQSDHNYHNMRIDVRDKVLKY